jgi:hypothetical protein
MPAPVLQFKRGNAGVAGTVPALRPGEPAISLNNFDFFIGIDSSVANNKFFGSHRYWERENGTTSLRLNLVDKNGSNYVSLKTPNTLAGIVTYTLPGTQGAVSSTLTNDGSGNLTWSSGSQNPVFTGISTFSDATDNTLGDSNTGAVRIDGGLGVDKNVTIGGNLNVQGYSEFVGVVTFKGGTISIGDSSTDNINVAGEFVSNLTPNDDNTYDIGIGTQRWKNANFSGVVTATTFSGTATTATRATLIDTTTTSDNATYYVTFVDTSGGQTSETLRVGSPISLNASTGDVTVSGDLQITGNDIKSSTGAVAITLAANDVQIVDDLTVGGNLYVNGSTTQVNTSSISVEDRTIELGVVDGSVPSSATTWDLGVLFNYYNTSAKKSALVWEQNDSRFKLGSVVSDGGDVSGNTNPQITITTYAALEISDLWINNSCTGSSTQVIGCVGSELHLQNIVIDAGSF